MVRYSIHVQSSNVEIEIENKTESYAVKTAYIPAGELVSENLNALLVVSYDVDFWLY